MSGTRRKPSKKNDHYNCCCRFISGNNRFVQRFAAKQKRGTQNNSIKHYSCYNNVKANNGNNYRSNNRADNRGRD